MVFFCQKIILEIESANNEPQLNEIIKNSIRLYNESKNPTNESLYIMNMIVSLQVVKTEIHTAEELKNIKAAIEIFRHYKAKTRQHLF